MKSTDLIKKLKELTGARTNEQVLERVEALLSKNKMPYGLLFMIDPDNSGMYWPVPIGEPGRQGMEVTKGVLRHFIEQQIEPTLNALREREIEARVRAELLERDPKEEAEEGR